MCGGKKWYNVNKEKSKAVKEMLYKMRKEKIERVFADTKEKHAMRDTPYRCLTQVTNWAKLKFACLNLKKLALWKSKDNHNTNKYPIFTRFFIAIWKNYN
mgnify:CR=1 FL=1